MKYRRLSKKELHLNPLKYNQITINYKEYNLLPIIYYINKSLNNYVHKMDVRINFMMMNKDFRLLWRESSLLLSFLLKIRITQPSKNYIYSKFLNSLIYHSIKRIKRLKCLNLIQKWNIPLRTIPTYNNLLNNQNKITPHSQPNYFKRMWINITHFQIKILQSDKKISIIRSPFVYSKSKESFSLYNYALLISLTNFPNMFTSLYLIKMQCYYNKYTLPLLIKCLK